MSATANGLVMIAPPDSAYNFSGISVYLNQSDKYLDIAIMVSWSTEKHFSYIYSPLE